MTGGGAVITQVKLWLARIDRKYEFILLRIKYFRNKKRSTFKAGKMVLAFFYLILQYAHRLFHEPNFLRTEPKVR
jgi:hypothetical protein